MNKSVKVFYVIGAIIISLIVACAALFTNKKSTQKISGITDPEMLMELTYKPVTDQDKKIDNCEFVEFSAYFLRDLNNDGYAEKYNGACNRIDKIDTMYVEFNVLTQGYLKDGEITINAENFDWKTSFIEDDAIKGDYLGKTTHITLQDKVYNGTQKTVWGTISPVINGNVNNYSKVNSVTFTGTHVIENGDGTTTETPISKTVDLTVDWHTYASTRLKGSSQQGNLDDLKRYGNVNFEIESVENVSDKNYNVMIQGYTLSITLPEINGYAPISASIAGMNCTYYPESRILTAYKSSTKEESGVVNKTVFSNNYETVNVKYPHEAFDTIEDLYYEYRAQVKVTYSVYNNTNPAFTNPYHSDDQGGIKKTYIKTEPKGYIWNLNTAVGYVKSYNAFSETYNYQMSKEKPIDLYNGNLYEEGSDIYPVKWTLSVGKYDAINNVVLREIQENNNPSYDKFNGTDSMKDYTKIKGIYFNGADMFGPGGWIKLYNDETNELIDTFTSENWSTFNEENLYKINAKAIRIEASNPTRNGGFSVNIIKEIDDKALTQAYTREEFDEFTTVRTYLTGTITAPDGGAYDGGSTSATLERTNFADYNEPYSTVYLNGPASISSQKSEEVTFQIHTETSQNILEKKWQNGTFLIELPEEIIDFNLLEVTTGNMDLNITGYYYYEENGKYYVRINTENEEPDLYTIDVRALVTANPLIVSGNTETKLYAYNEYCDNYSKEATDIYDIDGDGLVNDNVGYATKNTAISNVISAGLMTTEFITNYDDNGSVTLAPKVADIEKSNEQRTATVNVQILNNYSGKISEISILGKIPFEGNTYTINGRDLNSKFTANITGPITVPEALQDNVIVYYSEKADANKDLEDASNGWKTAENVTSWNNIKTYLITLNDYELSKSEEQVFTYEVSVPAGLGYEKAAFSHHAVYYYLNTPHGKLEQATEPNKVGIQIVGKYNLKLTKNKKGSNNVLVANATYKVETKDASDNSIVKIATTDRNGVLKFNGLYVEKEYTLTEISSSKDYAISTEVIKFVGRINTSGQLEFEVKSGNFKNTPTVSIDENNNYVVNANVEDEVKYKLTINKKGESAAALPNAVFSINGRGVSKNVKADENGQIVLDGLYIESEYELKEIKAEGYYINSEPKRFKITRNNQGILQVQTEDSEFNAATITEQVGTTKAEVSVTITNEKLPKYNLEVIKVKENASEDNLNNLVKIPNAKYNVISEYTGETNQYTTDENGKFDAGSLYISSYKDYRVGEYVIKEVEAPDNYAINNEEVRLAVTQDNEGHLVATVLNENESETYKAVYVDGNTVRLVLQNKSLFQLKKIDSETGLPLANAEFIIYEINEAGKEIGYAKDGSGKYVGTLNANGDYTVKTDVNGEVPLSLVAGIYKAVEVTYPDGYLELGTEEIFKIAGKADQEEEPEDPEEPEDESGYTVIEVDSINDLVNISNGINSSNRYNNYLIKLTKDLDVTKDEDYEDLSIKSSMTQGMFVPIGSSIYPFEGIFDGQGHKLKINVQSIKNEKGVFGSISNATIRNLEVSGYVNGASSTYYSGGIVGETNGNSRIENCINNSILSYSNDCTCSTGGIVGRNLGSLQVINCINNSDISRHTNGDLYIGGIVGYSSTGLDVKNCINNGKIIGAGGGRYHTAFGGIVGYGGVNIVGCKNLGEIRVESSCYGYAGGIVAEAMSSTNIEECCNEANIFARGSSNTYSAGICASNSKSIYKCYNTAFIECVHLDDNYSGYAYAGGILAYGSSNIGDTYNTGDVFNHGKIERLISGGIAGTNAGIMMGCYNTGDITCKSARGAYNGGICGYWNGGRNGAVNCYNTGNVITDLDNCDGYTSVYQGGIIGYGVVEKSYNTGDVMVYGNSDHSGAFYIGGIAGNNGARETYNTGKIICTVTTQSDLSTYIGGISGYGSAKNSYNTGDITNRLKSGGSVYAYVGGIVGFTSSATNCYNTGNIDSQRISSNGYTRRIMIGTISPYERYVNNSYYLDSIQIQAENIIYDGIPVSDADLKSEEVYYKLNVDDVWYQRKFGYPVLKKGLPMTLRPATELTIQNTIKKHRITTEVEGDVGGTISGSSMFPYETVVHNENNQKEILMTPESNYYISKITINGKEIDISDIPIGSRFSLPAEYFTNMTEDKHIVVTYSPYEQVFVKIIKVDEDDNTIPLEGAVYQIDNTYYGTSVTATTNEFGVIIANVKAGPTVIKEIKAPEGYVLDETEHETILNQFVNTFTFTDKKNAHVTVHHYLVGTTNKVADDEIYRGDIGAAYSTSPHLDLEGLTLQKDGSGEYILPENAKGVYTEQGDEVIYYYEANDIQLTINHYVKSTRKKLANTKVESTPATVTFDGEGNYTVTTEAEVVLDQNEDYNELKDQYDFEFVRSSIQEEPDIEETLTYNRDSDVDYFYDIRSHVITAEVNPHIENRTSETTGEKEEVLVNGGTVALANNEESETVVDGDDSTQTITATPDENYRVSKITLVSTNGDGEETTTIIYGDGASANPEVTATLNNDGTVTVSTFENVKEDKKIIVEFEPIPGNVVVHYYYEGTGEEYGNEPVLVKLVNGEDANNVVLSDLVGEPYLAGEIDGISPMYIKTSVSGDTVGTYIDGTINVYYYYRYATSGYRIEHYYEDLATGEYLIDNNATDNKYADAAALVSLKENEKKIKTGYSYTSNDGPITITEVPENNVIKVYYSLNAYKYTVKYLEKDNDTDDSNNNVLHEPVTKTELPNGGQILYGTTIPSSNEVIDITGYVYNSCDKDVLTIGANNDENIITIYYNKGTFAYEVHYWYDGVLDSTEDENATATYLDVITYDDIISEFGDKIRPGYVLVDYDPVNANNELALEISANPTDNVINVYYRTQYRITAEVIPHEQKYKDGTTATVEGGSILQSASDEYTGENVLKGDDSTKNIIITPDDGYEIYSIKITDSNGSTYVDLDDVVSSSGIATLRPSDGYFTDVQSNILIEVEFRKKSNVIVKYLSLNEVDEHGEHLVLAEEEVINGYETKAFETGRKPVQYYKIATIAGNEAAITDENDANITTYTQVELNAHNNAIGTMYADTLTVIYWYERIPAGIIVRHIAVTEADKRAGLNLESGTELDYDELSGYVSQEETTNRNTYENYISETGPVSTDEDMIIAEKTEDTKVVTYKQNPDGSDDSYVIEVRYYYIRQFKLNTEVRPHDEDGTEVDGGTITGQGTPYVEKINQLGENATSLVITPEYGYRVSAIEINGESIDLTTFDEDANHVITIPAGYFTDVNEDITVVVEFEKIPAKVITKYVDIDTGEEIEVEVVQDGFVKDPYTTEQKEIESYVFQNVEGDTTGEMVEEDTIVTYYYKKQFKITTEVKVHDEVSHSIIELPGSPESNITINKVKGGKITGEDENPYEIVFRGESSTKEIVLVPDKNYKIISLTVNGKNVDIKDEKGYKLDQFDDMQCDIHIVVTYEKIPATLIVKYIDEETGEEIETEEKASGNVDEDYKTNSKTIKNYKLSRTSGDEEGKLKAGDNEVIYYYKKVSNKSVKTGNNIPIFFLVAISSILTAWTAIVIKRGNY